MKVFVLLALVACVSAAVVNQKSPHKDHHVGMAQAAFAYQQAAAKSSNKANPHADDHKNVAAAAHNPVGSDSKPAVRQFVMPTASDVQSFLSSHPLLSNLVQKVYPVAAPAY